MPNLARMVEQLCDPIKQDFSDKSLKEWLDRPHSSREVGKKIIRTVQEVRHELQRSGQASFEEVEKALVSRVFLVGRLFVLYFLTWREERSRGRTRRLLRRGFWLGNAQDRQLGTFFGKVRYWRTYARSVRGVGGTYPLDLALGLTRDAFSMVLISLMARLATYMSFDRATWLLSAFLRWSPSKTTFEKSVLGLGRYTEEWFLQSPPPDGDGDVLIIQIDSKAVPTATEQELEKRRGKRRQRRYPKSPRHRGREKRLGYGEKHRRKKGDKSKNGKMATLVVMYTLKKTANCKGEPYLAGPLNKVMYASFAPKEHAFQMARHEADKRGFRKGSGRIVQVITDGDTDLEAYTKNYFPEARHTLDLVHALEYLWTAAGCVYDEGSEEMEWYYAVLKVLLSDGKILEVLAELQLRLNGIPTTGPGNKGRRERLKKSIGYLSQRSGMMNYRELREQDLEITSGAVEGAVKDVITARFDFGGMRWIRERSEALLQLRCIETNKDWDRFIEFVQRKISEKASSELKLDRILTQTPGRIPEVVSGCLHAS